MEHIHLINIISLLRKALRQSFIPILNLSTQLSYRLRMVLFLIIMCRVAHQAACPVVRIAPRLHCLDEAMEATKAEMVISIRTSSSPVVVTQDVVVGILHLEVPGAMGLE